MRSAAAVLSPQLGRADRACVAAHQVTLSVDPLSNQTTALLPGIIARAERTVAANHVAVAGATAQVANTAHLADHDAAVVIPVVLVAIWLLLFADLRSLVAAAYPVATGVLAHGAVLGPGSLVLTDFLPVGAWAGGVSLPHRHGVRHHGASWAAGVLAGAGHRADGGGIIRHAPERRTRGALAARAVATAPLVLDRARQGPPPDLPKSGRCGTGSRRSTGWCWHTIRCCMKRCGT